MLIDEFLPEYDFYEVHDLEIEADTERVYQAIDKVDFCDSWIVRLLFLIRGLPTSGMTMDGLKKMKFARLGETANSEVVLGLVGQFWNLAGNLKTIDRDSFRSFDEQGFAKTAFNFSLRPLNGGTRLATETRIKCLGDESRISFGRYWTLVRPFSGLIRLEMLKTIKHKAEAVIK